MGYSFDLPDHTLSLLRRTSFTQLSYEPLRRPDAKEGKEKDGKDGRDGGVHKHSSSSPLLASIKGVSLPKLIEKIVFFEGMHWGKKGWTRADAWRRGSETMRYGKIRNSK